MPVDSLQEQEERDADGRFLKGHSGNPHGRRPGSRNKATEAAELLLDSEAETLTRRAVELALDGQLGALPAQTYGMASKSRKREKILLAWHRDKGVG